MANESLTSTSASASETEHHLPAPTAWPFVMAAGVTLIFFGPVSTQLIFTAVGAVLFAVALGGWIGEMRHG